MPLSRLSRPSLQTIRGKVSTPDNLSWRCEESKQEHSACCIVESVQKLDYVARDCYHKAPGPLEKENRVELPLKFTQEN